MPRISTVKNNYPTHTPYGLNQGGSTGNHHADQFNSVLFGTLAHAHPKPSQAPSPSQAYGSSSSYTTPPQKPSLSYPTGAPYQAPHPASYHQGSAPQPSLSYPTGAPYQAPHPASYHQGSAPQPHPAYSGPSSSAPAGGSGTAVPASYKPLPQTAKPSGSHGAGPHGAASGFGVDTAPSKAPNVVTIKPVKVNIHDLEGKFLFRGDGRPPEEIFKTGFKPKKPDYKVDIWDYAKNNKPGDLVSTSKASEPGIKFAKENGGYLYSIRPHKTGIDINKALGKDSPFPHEKEVAMPSGIPNNQIKYATEVDKYGNPGMSFKNPLYNPTKL